MPLYRSRASYNPKPLIDTRQFIQDFGDIAGDIGEEAGREIQPHFKEDMQHYAPVPPGSKYKRTFDLRNKMNVRYERHGKDGELIAESGSDHTKWVVGTFDVSRNYQTRVHAQHGWILIRRIAAFWFDAYEERVNEKFDAVVPDYFGAYGIRRRNR